MSANQYNSSSTALSGVVPYSLPDGQTLDNCVIGATTPVAGTFAALTCSSFKNTGTITPRAIINVGTSTIATVGQSGQVFALNTAGGSTLTLPAATGSGARYSVVVTTSTTGGSHKILAASVADFINGIAIGFTGSTAKVFASAAATNHSLQMPNSGSQPSGGIIGDTYEIIDVAANLWNISGQYQAGTTPTTPYSTATT